MTAPTPEHLYCFVHGWTLSHGMSKGKGQGTHCRTLHAPSTPYTQAQLNAQDPRTVFAGHEYGHELYEHYQ